MILWMAQATGATQGQKLRVPAGESLLHVHSPTGPHTQGLHADAGVSNQL